jgi:chromosome segregation ATPase
MSDQLVLPSAADEHQDTPPDSTSDDISHVVTTRLRLHQRPVEPNDQQIAQHEAEIKHLEDLVATLEQAITGLMRRLRLTTEPRGYEALKHSCGDLQRFKLEVGALQAEHQRAIDRLQVQK